MIGRGGDEVGSGLLNGIGESVAESVVIHRLGSHLMNILKEKRVNGVARKARNRVTRPVPVPI